MLSKLTITMQREDGMNLNAGSLMQGILMEKISPDYAAELHQGSVNPYSQALHFNETHIHWTISTLNEEAERNILRPLLENTDSSIVVRHKELDLKILKKELTTISYEQLMDETYFGQCSPYLEIHFDSPTAFKVDGAYQFYPTVPHIFQSLIRKYDAFSNEEPIFSEELMKDIGQNVYLSKYHLKSTLFYLEKTRIPSFRGALTFRIQGPQLFRNLLHMLAAFGEYSGVGIKTAMGMGAIRRVLK